MLLHRAANNSHKSTEQSETASRASPAGSTANRRGNPTVLGVMLLCSQFSFVPEVLWYLYSFLPAENRLGTSEVGVSPLCADRDGRRQAEGGGWRTAPSSLQ